MAKQYLSDDEVFGTNTGTYISEDEVFGTKPSAGSGRGLINRPSVTPAAAAPEASSFDAMGNYTGPASSEDLGVQATVLVEKKPAPKPATPSVMDGYKPSEQDIRKSAETRLSYGAGPVSTDAVRAADDFRSAQALAKSTGQKATAPNAVVKKVAQGMDDTGIKTSRQTVADLAKPSFDEIDSANLASQRKKTAEEFPLLSSVAAGGAGIINSFTNIPPMAADLVNQTFVNPVLQSLGMKPLARAPYAPGTEYLKQASAEYMPEVSRLEMGDAYDQGKFMPWLATKLAANSPQIVMQLAAAFVPPLRAVMLPTIASSAAGASYADGDDSRVAAAKGVIEFATEKLPLQAFDKIGDALKGMSSLKQSTILAVAGQRALQAGGAITANGITNAIEETIAQLGGNVLDKYLQNKDIDLTDKLGEAAVVGGVTGKLMSLPQVAGIALGKLDTPPPTVAPITPPIDPVAPAAPTSFTPAGSPTELAGLAPIVVPSATAPTEQSSGTNGLINTATEQQFGLDKLRIGTPNVSTTGNTGELAATGSGLASSDTGGSMAGTGSTSVGATDSGVGGDATGVRPDSGSTAVAGMEAGQPAASVGSEYNNAVVEPMTVMMARNGTGYATEQSATVAMQVGQKREPTLDWRVEPIEGGRFRVAAYQKQEIMNGTQATQAVQAKAQGSQQQAATANAAGVTQPSETTNGSQASTSAAATSAGTGTGTQQPAASARQPDLRIPEGTLSDAEIARLSENPSAPQARLIVQASLKKTEQITGQKMPTLGTPDANAEATVNVLGNLFGEATGMDRRVIAYSNPGGENGFSMATLAFVNTSPDTDVSAPRTTLHEIRHVVEQMAEADLKAGFTDTPAQKFTASLDSIFDDITDEGKRAYITNFLHKKELAAITNATDREARVLKLMQSPLTRSEMAADFLGNRAHDRAFLNDLAKADPKGFEGFVKKWLAVVDNLMERLRGSKTQGRKESAKVDGYIRDLEKAKIVAREALIEFRKGMLGDEAVADTAANANGTMSASARSEKTTYPLAPRSEWYGEGTYKQDGGRLVTVTPDEYLASVRPLTMDDESRENIDLLKEHITSGKTLDPLLIRANGKEDGRHRAYAAKELGIDQVPVIAYGDQFKDAVSANEVDAKQSTPPSSQKEQSTQNGANDSITMSSDSDNSLPTFSKKSDAGDTSKAEVIPTGEALIAIHNLTVKNLLYADEIGGLPVPSIGVTKAASPFTGFGNITLLASKDMVDPSTGTPVFDRDAYTARFPALNYKKPTARKVDEFYERVKSARNFGDDGFVSRVWDGIKNASSPNPDSIASLFDHYVSPRALFAKEVLGKDIKVPMRSVKVPFTWANDKQFIDSAMPFLRVLSDMSGSLISDSTEFKQLADLSRKRMEAYVDKSGTDGAKLVEAIGRKDALETLATFWGNGGEWAADNTKMPGFKFIDRLSDSIRNADKKEVDDAKLSIAVNKLVGAKDPAYIDWYQSLIKPLFDAPTITLRGKQVAPTLDNIVDSMTVGVVTGAEKTMTMSAGKVSAMLGKKFKSLAEIKAGRNQVVSSEQESSGKKETDKLLDQYRLKALEFFTEKDFRGQIDTWAGMDAAMEALAIAGKGSLTDGNVRVALQKNGFKGVDQQTIDMAKQAVDALRSAVTDYFEAKPQRAVSLNEFRGALLPKGVDQKAADVLKKNGIKTVEYNPKKDGDREAKLEKLSKQLDKEAGDIRFSERQTETPQFKKWFRYSKVVDENGKPLVVYHGTRGNFTIFEQGRKSINTNSFGRQETSRSGSFFSPDKDFATTFAEQDGTPGEVMETYLSIQEPFDMRAGVGFRLREAMRDAGIDVQNLPEYASSSTWKAFDEENGKKLVAFLKERDYDGAIITEENEDGDSVDVYIAFDPTQIKSATGNNGDFDVTNPDIRFSNREERGANAMSRIAYQGYGKAPVPVVPAARNMAGIIAKLDAGKLTPQEFELQVRMLAERMTEVSETKAANKIMSERQRGADIVREKLIAARRRGEINPGQTEFALWALQQNQNLAEGLGVTVRDAPESAAGSSGDYNPAASVMRVFKFTASTTTAVHEILHHTERMMPQAIQRAIRIEWSKAYAKAMRKSEGKLRAALEQMIPAMAGDKTARDAVMDAFNNGTLNVDKHYQLTNPSEFWAVNATDILSSRFEAGSWVGKAKQWMREFLEKAKGLVGMRSNAPILRALKLVMEGNGERLSKDMLTDLSRMEQRAFHGSPHRGIDKFSTDKIGTGEGAQAYGWGLYFASLRDIAEHYRNILSGDGFIVADQKVFDPSALQHLNVKSVARSGDLDAAIAKARDISQGDSPVAKLAASDLAVLEDVKARGGISKNIGQLYEVEIPEDSEMLLWDKPLSKQPEKVRRALNGLHSELKKRALATSNIGTEPTGQAIYGAMQEYFSEGRRNDVFSNGANFGQKEASMELLDSGIKGIKYLDSTSRSDGDGSYNYVVFDGDDTEITGINFSNRQTDGWLLSRDDLGRFRFGAGAKAYRYAANVANAVLDKVSMAPISTDLSRAMRKMKSEVERAQNLTADVAKQMKDLPEQERQMISDVIEGELKRGIKPPKRVLEIAASMQSIMSEQSAELVRLGMLTAGAAGRWDGKYLPRFYEQKIGDEVKGWAKAAKALLGGTKIMQGIGGSSLKGRGIFQNVPVGELEQWLADGWEERDPNFDPKVDTEITVWKDYTRDQRDDMGEIRDAMFRFVMGYNKSQRDIALGRLYENLANDIASKKEQPGFVQVPSSTIENTTAKRYGKLSGMWVPKEVLDHLSAHDTSMQNDLLKMYLKGLSMWKEGKALALDTPIPTPTGWTTMGDIKECDTIFDEHGKQCKVVFATPVQLDRKCFEVEFSDGEKIVADAEHLWFTIKRGNPGVRTTEEILATLKEATRGDNNHSIPVAGALDTAEAELPLAPYALGVWLGDGHKNRGEVTSCQQDYEELCANLSGFGVLTSAPKFDKRSTALGLTLSFNMAGKARSEGLQPTLRNMGLLSNKHIPDQYLRASTAQRLELLQGLMDTDGSITERGQCEFSTTIPALFAGVMELMRSLSLKPSSAEFVTAAGSQAWRIKFQSYGAEPVFLMARKAVRLASQPENAQRSRTRQIVAITPIESVPVRCIQVSSESRLYLAGRGMIPTHNTVLNPVSHANNVLSNLTMAHFAGISYWDVQKYAGAVKDLVKGSPMINEARDAGLFGGTFNRDELMNDMPDQLKLLAGMSESKLSKGVDHVWNAMSFWVRKPAGKAYEAEDLFFRYLIYRDARQKGLDVDDAVDYAQTYIFTYDDLPKGARAVRDTALPFFSYTYKVVPALAKTALEYPWRYAAPALALYTINAAMYAMAASLGGGDDEDWWTVIQKYVTDPEFREKARGIEQQERSNLPPWMKGASFTLGTPKAVRMGMDDVTNLPMFLDVSRLFPGGDLLDAQNNAGGVPLLQPITPSSPVLNTIGAMLWNKEPFFGKEVVDVNDTNGEAAAKRGKWLWQQFAPAVAIGNYHWDRALNVIANQVGSPVLGYTGTGKDGLPVQASLAAMQTVGIKLRPVDLDLSEQISQSQKKKLISDLDLEIKRITRLENKGAITGDNADEQRELQRQKKERLREGLDVNGKEKK